MINKIAHTFEGAICLMSIIWQPLFGILASIFAIIYYGSMLKINVIDVKYGGSWKEYFKSFINRKNYVGKDKQG